MVVHPFFLTMRLWRRFLPQVLIVHLLLDNYKRSVDKGLLEQVGLEHLYQNVNPNIVLRLALVLFNERIEFLQAFPDGV